MVRFPARVLAMASWLAVSLPLAATEPVEILGANGARASLARTGDFADGVAAEAEPAPPLWPMDQPGGVDRETVLLLHLDDPAKVTDAADPKRALKAEGITATDGRFGKALSFTGKARVTVGGPPLGVSLRTPFRVETWIRPRKGGVALSLDRRFYVLVSPGKDGKWVAHLKHRKSDKGGDFGSVYSSPLPLSDKAWHQLAIHYDGKGGVAFLCDGKPAGKATMPHDTESTGTGDGCLGAHDGWLGWYDGDLDEVRVQVRQLPRGKAKLTVRVQDEKGQALPVRCSLVGGDGKPVDPVGKGMSKSGEFSTEGNLSTVIPAGTCRLRAQRDWRWGAFSKPFTVDGGGEYALVVTLPRWYDTQGWVGGNTHFHTYHGPKHRIKVATLDEEGKRDYEVSGLMCRASGLDWALTSDVDGDYARAVAASRPNFIMTLANERRCDYWCGHLTSPGTKDLHADNSTAFAGLSVIDEGHAQGGALIYTHPMNLPRIHHMTSVAALSHASLSTDLGADLFDIGCGNRDLAFAELLAFWGSGWRLGVASGNDLGLEAGGDPGLTQTYVHPNAFEWPAVLKELRARRTVGVVGDAFAMVDVDGQGPGGTVQPGQHTVRIEAASRAGLKVVRLLVNGIPQELPEAKGKQGYETTQQLQLANGDWVTVEARGNGYAATALATPVWCGEPVRGDRHSAIFVVTNFDRAGRQAESFWAHLIATVNDSRQIASATLLHDGKSIATANATAGNRLPESGLLPLVGGAPKGATKHDPSWVFWPSADKAQHIRMSWPAPEAGVYSFRVTLSDGSTIGTGGIRLADPKESYCYGIMQFHSPQSSLWTQSSAKGVLNTDYNHLYFTVEPYFDALSTVNGHARRYSQHPSPDHRAVFTPPDWVAEVED